MGGFARLYGAGAGGVGACWGVGGTGAAVGVVSGLVRGMGPGHEWGKRGRGGKVQFGVLVR